MDRDDSLNGCLSRVRAIGEETRLALQAGLRVATKVHSEQHWSVAADVHCFHQLVRREAMEHLKALDPQLEDHDNLGFAMSGLVLRTQHDVVRVWHTPESRIPVPTSERGRDFVCQRPAWAPLTFVQDELPELPSRPNHLIIQWSNHNADLTRFNLVRPNGVSTRPACVTVDWVGSLLPETTAGKDVSYRLRSDRVGEEDSGT